MTRPACARGVWQHARAHGLARGSRDTKHCIVAEGRLLCRYTAQPGLRYGALRHGVGALRHARQGLGSRFNICIVAEGRDTVHDTTCKRARARNDTAVYARDMTGRALRHGQARPATQRNALILGHGCVYTVHLTQS